jgi:hypothetical protein
MRNGGIVVERHTPERGGEQEARIGLLTELGVAASRKRI